MLLDNLSQFIRRGGDLKENYIGSKQVPPESINLGALVTGIDHRLLSDSIQVIFWCCAKKKRRRHRRLRPPPGVQRDAKLRSTSTYLILQLISVARLSQCKFTFAVPPVRKPL